jgi:hypothetical protein
VAAVMAVMPPSNPDAFSQRAPHRDLLPPASHHDRSGGDARDALDACAFRHAEAKRLDSGDIVIDRHDLEVVAGASGRERTRLAWRGLGAGAVSAGHGASSEERISTC